MQSALLRFCLILAVALSACTARSTPVERATFGYKARDLSGLVYAGRTIVFHDPLHGTQVEYYRPDGASFLWYPGNRRALPGRWERRAESERICFRYGPRTYNPVTGDRGSGWKCVPQASHRALAKGACKGDPFNLASGRLPFAISKPKWEKRLGRKGRTLSKASLRGGPDLQRVLATCGGKPATQGQTPAPSAGFDASVVAACKVSFPNNEAGCGCLPRVTPKMNRATRSYLLASVKKGDNIGVPGKRGADITGVSLIMMRLQGTKAC